jgi:hypothetical protein
MAFKPWVRLKMRAVFAAGLSAFPKRRKRGTPDFGNASPDSDNPFRRPFGRTSDSLVIALNASQRRATIAEGSLRMTVLFSGRDEEIA